MSKLIKKLIKKYRKYGHLCLTRLSNFAQLSLRGARTKPERRSNLWDCFARLRLARNDKNPISPRTVLGDIENFIKYHNAFTIVLVFILIASATMAASPTAREKIIGKAVVEKQGIDNSVLLSADLDNFDFQLKITNVKEDEENYYIDYQFVTLDIKDNAWQKILRQSCLNVSKSALAGQDLGLYVQKELGEVADSELAYLKKVQAKEKEKGKTKIVKTKKYTGLIGLSLDIKNKILPGYEPVVKPPKPKMVISQQPQSASTPDVKENPTSGVESTSGDVTGATVYYFDADSDGFGDPNNIFATTGAPPSGYISDDTDCDDTNPAVHPGAQEICGDGIDNNCDGTVDEGLCLTELSTGTDSQPATPTPEVSLTASTSTCATGTEITFTATTTNFATTTLTYAWDFGDGVTTTTTSTDTDSTTHTYNATGTYTVSVTATAGDQTASTSTQITIVAASNVASTTSPETCASSSLQYCTTTDACAGVGGFWYNDTCNAMACTPNWQCSDWQSTSTAETTACGQTFTQTRTCTDLNNCGDDSTKPAETQEAIGNGDAGITSCDASKNLVGECQNSCVGGQIQTCTPTCSCAQGYSDCNGDGTGSDLDGCETASSTCPAI